MAARSLSPSRFVRIGAVAAMVASPPIHAASGDTMTITATVLPSCSVTADAMAFGDIDPARPQRAVESVLTLQCSPGTAFAVSLDQGQNGARRMANVSGAGFLDYEIYRDAAGTTPWGSAAGGGAVTGVAPGSGTVSLAAYGRVVSRTTTPGRYQDVVTVTVQF